jgi:hypothetical protein
MAVQQDQITVDPYKSTVPLVPLTQVPQQDLQPQQAPKIYGKAGGIAQFADTAMKGLLKGLQIKQETKFKAAEATMATQDAAIADAKKRYNDALMMYGKDDERTKAAWGEYGGTVNKAADMYEAFGIPKKETGTKSQKKAQGAKDKAAGIPVQGGFIDHLKHIASQNPELIPQIAIAGMRSQVDPKLYGQITPEMTAAQQKQQQEAAVTAREQTLTSDVQRKSVNEQTYQSGYATFARLGEDEIAALPPDVKKQYDQWLGAKAALMPMRQGGAMYTYMVNGKPQKMYPEDAREIGAELYVPGATPKEGTQQDAIDSALKASGVDKNKDPMTYANAVKFYTDWFKHQAAQTSSSTRYQTVTDPTTNKLVQIPVGSSATRGAAAPRPQDYGLPTNFPTPGENGKQQQDVPKSGGMGRSTVPRQAAKGSMAASTLPPGVRDTGIKSMLGVGNTQRVETEEKGMYTKADTAYQAALKTNKAKAPDKASLDAANAQALQAFNASKAQIVLWKAAQVKAVGGDPWKPVKDQQTGQMRQFAADANGNTYGTMDGVNWVNINTGMPFEGK